ncbi:hypothetical protein JCM9279_006113, partial [Rhodotorula babjevae]
ASPAAAPAFMHDPPAFRIDEADEPADDGDERMDLDD